MQQLINWIKVDIVAVIISAMSLLLAIYLAYRQQKQWQREETKAREAEKQRALEWRAKVEQQLKLHTQKENFRDQQMSQILEWISQLTFSNRNKD